ncbi:hypothetical protein HPB50_020577 [Hyalomma asiaticum]|uniref:Uncharacterized protein n=1 Tax=Hyalomma asiaticum TaxID=266040 RepID=A0ACB7SPR2_HYAAI|nr:hypothetical protein HPB50_020577 [Hyalomma asiaticum]
MPFHCTLAHRNGTGARQSEGFVAASLLRDLSAASEGGTFDRGCPTASKQQQCGEHTAETSHLQQLQADYSTVIVRIKPTHPRQEQVLSRI